MAKMLVDEDGLLEEPCLSCDKVDIWRTFAKICRIPLEYITPDEWYCIEKECPYRIEGSEYKSV